MIRVVLFRLWQSNAYPNLGRNLSRDNFSLSISLNYHDYKRELLLGLCLYYVTCRKAIRCLSQKLDRGQVVERRFTINGMLKVNFSVRIIMRDLWIKIYNCPSSQKKKICCFSYLISSIHIAWRGNYRSKFIRKLSNTLASWPQIGH